MLRMWTINGKLIGRTTSKVQVHCLQYTSAPEGVYVNVLVGGLANGNIRFCHRSAYSMPWAAANSSTCGLLCSQTMELMGPDTDSRGVLPTWNFSSCSKVHSTRTQPVAPCMILGRAQCLTSQNCTRPPPPPLSLSLSLLATALESALSPKSYMQATATSSWWPG